MTNEELAKYGDELGVLQARANKVVKHNDLVQKSRFSLSLVEQKTVNFLISLIKPKQNIMDVQPLEYEFDIQAYCKICGIDYANGKNYKMVRDTLKSLRDKSIIIQLPDGTDTPVSWVQKFWSNKGSGRAKVRFDEDIAPYLFEICENTTRFELLYVLPMKSKYAVRMYEICRSWAKLKGHTYTLEELRSILCIGDGELARYPDFRRKVLEISQKEINEKTDLDVEFFPITNGRKVIGIKIKIKEKSSKGKRSIEFKVNSMLEK